MSNFLDNLLTTTTFYRIADGCPVHLYFIFQESILLVYYLASEKDHRSEEVGKEGEGESVI